jgi:hypothetical protein
MMIQRQEFTSDDLAATGRALYGERWQTTLAQDLHVSDRTMRRWLAGDFNIPPAVATELRAVLIERLKTIGGIVRYTVNPRDHTIYHSVTYAAFQYDDAGDLTLLHRGFAVPEELPLITEGAKEALRQEQERDPRVKGRWLDRSGRPAAAGELHGFLRGSVIIPPDVDLTAPVIGEVPDAEQGKLHR